MNHKNTLEKGTVRYIVFQEKGKWFGAALEFNIVEEADDPLEALALLFEAIEGYVKTARKARLPLTVVNQEADKEYERIWQKQSTAVYTFGERPLVAV